MCRREAKHKQEAEQLNWYRFSPTEEWYKDKQDWFRITSPEE